MTSGDYSTFVGNDSYKGVVGIITFAASYVTTLGAETGLYNYGSYNTFIGAPMVKVEQHPAPYSSGDIIPLFGCNVSEFTTLSGCYNDWLRCWKDNLILHQCH